jgi:tricarballylate dehydrogenase
MTKRYDVAIAGAGNAALCAALAARQAGAEVIVLERAPYAERGGNSRFTAGAMRVAYRGVDDIRELVPDLSADELASTDFGCYPEETFYDDIARVTGYRADPDLTDTLVRRSRQTLAWMRDAGVRFLPIYGRQAFKQHGRFVFWGGLTIETAGGGPGLVDHLTTAAQRAGVDFRYQTRARSLVVRDGAVSGVEVSCGGARETIGVGAVVLATGGFQANSEWRTRYLGPGWDLVKVRGSRFSTGDGIRMALEVGAMSWGNWSGAHAVAWDQNAPPFGDLAVGDGFQKHSYPFSIMVNSHGERFLDEGADFRNYTYAKYGPEILAQPGQVAWQIFDGQVAHLLRDEYRIKQVTRFTGKTLAELAERIGDIDKDRFLRTVKEFNDSIDTTVGFDPNRKDGRRTRALSVPKSNWANPISEPPFSAYAVGCGITFTFGGLRINPAAEVISDDGPPIPGLYACGELVGGIFHGNYPGGSGLTCGAVFGRIAGTNAGEFSRGAANRPA